MRQRSPCAVLAGPVLRAARRRATRVMVDLAGAVGSPARTGLRPRGRGLRCSTPPTRRSALRWTAPALRPGRRSAAWTCCPLRWPGSSPSAGCARRTRSSSTARSRTAGCRSGSTRSRVGWRHVVAVHEQAVARTPFCTLLRFAKDLPARRAAAAARAARRADVGPLRHPARRHGPHPAARPRRPHHRLAQRPRRRRSRTGRFGLDEFVDHVIEFLAVLGPRAHVDRRLPALRARCWRPWRSWPRTGTSPQPREHDAGGRPGGRRRRARRRSTRWPAPCRSGGSGRP